MKYIVDENGFYKGFGGSKTVLQDGDKELAFGPDREYIRAKYDSINEVYFEGATEEEILNAREVPKLVPLWCIKVVLHEMGLLTTVENQLANLEEPMKTRASYIWEYGNQIDIESITVAFIGAVLQKDKTEIDTIFINANNIEL